MSGPNRLPTKILENRGSWLAKKRKNEMKAPAGRPKVPAWLTPKAKKCWKQVTKQLAEMKMLYRYDSIMLALLCQTYADYQEALAESQGKLTVVSDKGTRYQHPAVGAKNTAAKMLFKLAREFGMSPSARAGLTIIMPENTSDDLSKFFDKY